jgi:heme-degrading monooxygenase HmoA
MQKNQLCHHVLFWLNNPDNMEESEKFEKAARKLQQIPSIKAFHLGRPAPVTPRPVVDDTYTFSLVIFFDDQADHDEYQEHPIHQQFIQENRHLWERVRVYDSM